MHGCGVQCGAIFGDVNEEHIMPLHACAHAAQVFLFYPADWSFVCPAEIISFNEACATHLSLALPVRRQSAGPV